MKKRKRPKPNMVVLPDGSRYRIQVFRVEERHPDGTPKLLYWLRENEVTDLRTQSNQFILPYVNELNIGNGGTG